MCGFTGFFDKLPNKELRIKTMNDVISHRGPDGEGFYVDETIAMGFRRLSIIDLSHGDQPLYNENKTLVLNFNGEIYNYQTLREELIAKGHVFTTHSDSEVILHGYEEYQENIVNHLRGMFAFVIYNRETHAFFAARDHFGIKPLYYALQDSLFVYASEIKAILKHPQFKKQLNPDALQPYLSFQTSVLDETFFKDVFALKPGHMLMYKDNILTTRAYHSLTFEPSRAHTQEEVLALLKESVQAHKIADVEVGAFLSSGVDSSFIATTSEVDKTFTVGFTHDGFNECEEAKVLASMINSDHYSKIISEAEFFEVLSDVQYYADEPHANLSAVPLYFLAQLAAKKVKVVLSGEGADELFGGYDTYITTRKRALALKLPQGLRTFIGHTLSVLRPVVPAVQSWEEAFKPLGETYIGQANIMSEVEARQLLKSQYHSKHSNASVVQKWSSDDDALHKMSVDMNVWLNKDILTKADKMTMAHSLELRVPFLDKVVWNVARQIPVSQKVIGTKTKALFRDVALSVLPQAWAKRKKLGFMVPFKFWLLEPHVVTRIESLFMKPFVSDFFHQTTLMQLLKKHQTTQAEGRKLYAIVCFILWYERYFVQKDSMT